jgi:hypothetical protein
LAIEISNRYGNQLIITDIKYRPRGEWCLEKNMGHMIK